MTPQPPRPTEAPTPECDYQEEHASNVMLYIDCQQPEKWPHGPMVVPSDFARQLERDRDQLRVKLAEVERERDHAKDEFERYAGWSRWTPGLWLISHPESGHSAEFVGADATAALKATQDALKKIKAVAERVDDAGGSTWQCGLIASAALKGGA